jgi:hypothetical protein
MPETAGVGAGAPETKGKEVPDASGSTWSEKIKAIGGLVAVVVGVLIVGIIAVAALSKNTDTAATIASSAGGVIATIVGAYFGVKVGTDQAKTTIESQQEEASKSQKGQQAEAAKAQVYAMHIPPDNAAGIIAMAEKAAQDAIDR